MTSNAHNFSGIPAKRYFSLDELCELAQISPEQFAAWQRENGAVVGYGGNVYTRSDVVKIRRLKDTFAPYVDEFNRNSLDAAGQPAIKADEMRAELKKILMEIEKSLAN